MVFILVGSSEYSLEQDKTKNEVTQSCRSLWHDWCFGCSNQLEGHYWISKKTERAVWCKLIFVISNFSKNTITRVLSYISNCQIFYLLKIQIKSENIQEGIDNEGGSCNSHTSDDNYRDIVSEHGNCFKFDHTIFSVLFC